MLRLRKISHRTCFLLSHTVYLTCCCGCCSALRPRYKRLVDNIFPATPQEGLNKSNMEKLVFYSLSCPEKLDRIGEYLFQKASRAIYRRRHGYVIIAAEAMDQLLLACHAQTLNLFVESYLKMVQKLLESTDPELQILASQSFVRFGNIEEDTPSYHRRYDFFVSKFSSMCHNSHSEKRTRDKIRLAGIQGLQGVIRKTVSDDLVENIWEAQHMEKIVPSLLYNMMTAEKYVTVEHMDPLARSESEEPALLAEACLRELVGRASFGHIRSVLGPVLTHFDRHELWVPNEFAVHVFKIIMYSIQAQYSYSVVEALQAHLEAGVVGRCGRVRAARAHVLKHIVAIAASDSVGPSVLEIINNLLTNLRTSVTREPEEKAEEKLYQDALINALGEFADHLPDFQKIDIMMFIVSKIPQAKRGKLTKPDDMLQTILLKSLLKVGVTYRTRELSRAFPFAFLECLLRLARCDAPPTRALLHRVLHTLLDRHDNAPHLSTPTLDYAQLGLSIEKCSRPDLIFINKHGYAIYSALYEGLQLESNKLENMEAIYTTIALLCCELTCDEAVPDLLQLILSIQQSAISNPVLSRAQRFQLHAMVISLITLLPHCMHLPRLADYAAKIVESRREEAPDMLPPLRDDYGEGYSPSKMPYLMVDQLSVIECLTANGVEAGRLASPSPYSAGAPHAHKHNWLEAGATQGRDSLADITSGNMTELDSANSSPGVQRCLEKMDDEYVAFTEKYNQNHRPNMAHFGCYHPMQPESISLEALRLAAGGPTESDKREAERKKASLNSAFRTKPFDHLLLLTQPKYELKEKLEEIFNSISEVPMLPNLPPTDKNQPPYKKYFPELFLY